MILIRKINILITLILLVKFSDVKWHRMTSLVVGPQVEQTAWGRPRGRKKHMKRGAKGLAHSLSLPLSFPLAGVLFFSCLWVSMPSLLEDGFSCYFLNKIEL